MLEREIPIINDSLSNINVKINNGNGNGLKKIHTEKVDKRRRKRHPGGAGKQRQSERVKRK